MPDLRALLVAVATLLAGLGVPAAQAVPVDDAAARTSVPCSRLDTSQPGISRRSVRIANVVDVTGPIPGLFRSAQQAVAAYVVFFNQHHDLCGRTVELDRLDSRTDAARDQQAYADACARDFAAVGSMSAFDSGGARTAERCGLPDLRAETVTTKRRACDTCLAVHPTDPTTVSRAVPRHLAQTAPEAVAHAAMIYVDDPDHTTAAMAALQAADDEGWSVVYTQAISGAEPTYLPYAQQVEALGVQLVWFFGPAPQTARLQEAMRQWGYVPGLFLQDETIYDPAYVEDAGEDAVGVLVDLPHALLTDRGRELRRYRTWLARVEPGAVPDGHGLWAWSAAKLALTTMEELGGALSRETLVAALAATRTWSGGGMHPPQRVGSQRESGCELLARRTEDRWVRVVDDYLCAPLARAPRSR